MPIVTILYDLVLLIFPLVVGLAALIFYINKRRSGKTLAGMLLIAAAFLASAFLGLLNGVTVTSYLLEHNWTVSEFGLFTTVVGLVSRTSFTILMLIGLHVLYKEMTQLVPIS